MKKAVSILLIAVLGLSMAACGKKEIPPQEPAAQEETADQKPAAEEPQAEEPAAEPEVPDYTGIYLGQFDYTEEMSAGFGESLGFELEDPLYMDIYLELKEDETFTLSIDAEKFKADVIAIMTGHVDDIIAAALEQNGYTMDQLEEVAQQSGFENADAFRQEMIKQLESELDQSMNMDDLTDDISFSGTYTIVDNKIKVSSEEGEDEITINEDGTLSFVIPMDGEEVTLTMTKQE